MNNIRTYITVGALCSAMTISAQDRRISGTVSDEFGPVIGCNVIEKDANNRNVNATITDVNGNFQLAIKNPKNKLVVSYVGYKTFSQVIGSHQFPGTAQGRQRVGNSHRNCQAAFPR